jgi:hypothetical protein
MAHVAELLAAHDANESLFWEYVSTTTGCESRNTP